MSAVHSHGVLARNGVRADNGMRSVVELPGYNDCACIGLHNNTTLLWNNDRARNSVHADNNVHNVIDLHPGIYLQQHNTSACDDLLYFCGHRMQQRPAIYDNHVRHDSVCGDAEHRSGGRPGDQWRGRADRFSGREDHIPPRQQSDDEYFCAGGDVTVACADVGMVRGSIVFALMCGDGCVMIYGFCKQSVI